MAQLEKTIVGHITKWLKAQPDVYFFKTVGSSFQKRGLPDIVGSCGAFAFYFEAKTAKGRTSPKQDLEISRIKRAGAHVSVVRSLDDVRRVIEVLRLRQNHLPALLPQPRAVDCEPQTKPAPFAESRD